MDFTYFFTQTYSELNKNDHYHTQFRPHSAWAQFALVTSLWSIFWQLINRIVQSVLA